VTAPHQLHTIVIGDEPSSWAAAGFTVADNQLRVGSTMIVLRGRGDGGGILAVGIDGLGGELDGMPFDGPARDPSAERRAVEHTNHVDRFDHLVVMSPDMDRTTAALTGAGLEHRRTRTFGPEDEPRRQSFFWLGDVILEVAGLDRAHGEGPSQLWGLALTTSDLAGACAELGAAIGEPRDAVQTGRRIATVRTRELDVSVPIALMTPHPDPRGA
jgi:hypothetical protein